MGFVFFSYTAESMVQCSIIHMHNWGQGLYNMQNHSNLACTASSACSGLLPYLHHPGWYSNGSPNRSAEVMQSKQIQGTNCPLLLRAILVIQRHESVCHMFPKIQRQHCSFFIINPRVKIPHSIKDWICLQVLRRWCIVHSAKCCSARMVRNYTNLL